MMNSGNDKKGLIGLVVVLSVLVVGLSSYLIYDTVLKNKTNDKVEKYTLEKFAKTDVEITQNTVIYEKNGIIFLMAKSNDYLKIYDDAGNDITPKEINNKKLRVINKIEFNDDFLGYTLSTDSKGYYINNKGKVTLDFDTTMIGNINNYISVSSDKICYTSKFDNVDYHYYCTKIYDLDGNLLIDGTIENYVISRTVYNKDNYSLFEVTKNNKKGLVDNKGNTIIDFDYQTINYNENQKKLLALKDDNLYYVYDLKGNLLKKINLNDVKNDKNNQNMFTFAETIGNQKSFYLNDVIYLMDENYNLKEYKDIYFELAVGMDDFGKKYYITDNIYIKNSNGTYTVHDLEGKKIIDDEFKFVGPANKEGHGRIGVPNNYITLCKNLDRTSCGAIDFQGNVIIDFENELYNYQESVSDSGLIYDLNFNGFKNGNKYFDIVNNKVTKKITCDNLDNIYIQKYFENVIYVEDEQAEFNNGKSKIIDYDCNDLSEAKYHNIYEYDNFIVAQNSDWITYDVYNTNGSLIDYENKDNAKLTYFLGYNDGKLYFSYQNNIYVLKK